jgi:hypothetical protein
MLQRASAPILRSRWPLCETMWPLRSARARRTSGPEKFRSSFQKDFFNSIRTKRTFGKIPTSAKVSQPVGRDLAIAASTAISGYFMFGRCETRGYIATPQRLFSEIRPWISPLGSSKNRSVNLDNGNRFERRELRRHPSLHLSTAWDRGGFDQTAI